ncbi:MAG TPA: hypothetical protein PK156_36095 [Polyangium sp.]|nr:hypothetical protein [Polyangium sp.]
MSAWASRTHVGALAMVLVAGLTSSANLRADELQIIGVDRDDDDVNGRADSTQEFVGPTNDLVELPLPAGRERKVVVQGDAVRVLVDGKPMVGAQVPMGTRRVSVQGVRPGRAVVDLYGKTHRFAAVGVRPVDGKGNLVDPASSHASFTRRPPERLEGNPYGETDDLDALRFVLVAHPEDLLARVRLEARDPGGQIVDVLDSVFLGSVACPGETDPSLACGSTAPIRVVSDEIDRNHPTSVNRSLRAVLGGEVRVLVPATGRKLGAVRVGGPRQTILGPLVRYRGRLRVFLVRLQRGGPPPIGSDDQGALALVRSDVTQAGALWAACGISFGPPSELEVAIVDPPQGHLVAFGCDQSLPSTAHGKVRVRVDGREISAPIELGATPRGAARSLATALAKAGFAATVSDNPVIGPTMQGTSDLLVRRADGALALVEGPKSGPIVSDNQLSVCIGRVNLEDGLQHFGDVDAIAGTLEERALIKAFDDGDPSTIEVFVVPSFASGGRIGESFIGADGGALRNVVIEDRAALRADRASFTLAHELGHVLLDEPGHPDDFGIDAPSRLMDADAANGTAFGPRRLLIEECVRVLRQSGPTAPMPLLRPWPLSTIGTEH